MACCEQDIIGIDKRSCNSSNVANTIMVEQILRTRSGAANDYGKQVSVTPRYKSKTSSLSQTETACSDVHSKPAQTSTIQKETMSSMQRGDMERKTNINTYFVVKGTTIQHRLIQT